jgi:hypothetical protein
MAEERRLDAMIAKRAPAPGLMPCANPSPNEKRTYLVR